MKMNRNEMEALYAVKYPFGLVEYFVELDGDKIKKIKIAGDFFEEKDVNEFLKSLKGISIEEFKVKNFDIENYVLGFKNEFFVNDILKAIKE